MQWFQIKEQSAGEKRLLISWYLYKIFGKNILYFIAFWVAFFTFIFAKKVRHYSKKYFEVIKNKTGLKPSLVNQFKHIHSYAVTLVDKILFYANDFDPKNVIFENEQDKKSLYEDIYNSHGVFLIFNHLGNIEILKSYFLSEITKPDFNIDVFLSYEQSKIFNAFIDKIKINFPLTVFPVEEIGITTGITLKENLNRGDVVFMAGDRLAVNNKKNIKTKIFDRQILLPKGTFKLAELMDVPTYFITALKFGKKYKIFLDKQNNLAQNNMAEAFSKHLEKMVQIKPYQFYHFYDFFEE